MFHSENMQHFLEAIDERSSSSGVLPTDAGFSAFQTTLLQSSCSFEWPLYSREDIYVVSPVLW